MCEIALHDAENPERLLLVEVEEQEGGQHVHRLAVADAGQVPGARDEDPSKLGPPLGRAEDRIDDRPADVLVDVDDGRAPLVHVAVQERAVVARRRREHPALGEAGGEPEVAAEAFGNAAQDQLGDDRVVLLRPHAALVPREGAVDGPERGDVLGGEEGLLGGGHWLVAGVGLEEHVEEVP